MEDNLQDLPEEGLPVFRGLPGLSKAWTAVISRWINGSAARIINYLRLHNRTVDYLRGQGTINGQSWRQETRTSCISHWINDSATWAVSYL